MSGIPGKRKADEDVSGHDVSRQKLDDNLMAQLIQSGAARHILQTPMSVGSSLSSGLNSLQAPSTSSLPFLVGLQPSSHHSSSLTSQGQLASSALDPITALGSLGHSSAMASTHDLAVSSFGSSAAAALSSGSSFAASAASAGPLASLQDTIHDPLSSGHGLPSLSGPSGGQLGLLDFTDNDALLTNVSASSTSSHQFQQGSSQAGLLGSLQDLSDPSEDDGRRPTNTHQHQHHTASSLSSAQAADRSDAAPDLKQIVQEYQVACSTQRDSPDQTVIILHPRVVQKSYGSEKRFFCPAPCIMLSGKRWHTNTNGRPRVFVSMSSDPKNTDYHPVDLEPGDEYGSARSLYIQDQDKRKSFCLHFKVFFAQGRDVGTFDSRPIKVISKPSKKRQSGEMCIHEGSEVAIFNRVRAQGGSTRSLYSNQGNDLQATPKKWTPFVIEFASPEARARATQGAKERGIPVPSASDSRKARLEILYGSEVVLTCAETGYISPPLIVCRVERNCFVPDMGDSVSQLQKIGLQRKDTGEMMILLDDQVKFQSCKRDGRLVASEASSWTICNCDRAKYTFCEREPLDIKDNIVVNPVPVVQTVKTLGSMVELYGEGFSALLTVFFGDVEAKTMYRCEELLLCVPPKYAEISHNGDSICRKKETVELLLVRRDGTVYRTGRTYTYQVDHMALLLEIRRRKGVPVARGTHALLTARSATDS